MTSDAVANSTWRGRFWRYAPLLFWIGVIFYLSGGGGSFTESSRYIKPILEFLFPSASPETIALYHGFLRKVAHPTVYGILALFAARAFLTSSKDVLRRMWFPAALLTALLIASLDEFNQSMLASRTGAMADIALDLAGAAVAALSLLILKRDRSTAEPDRPPPAQNS